MRWLYPVLLVSWGAPRPNATVATPAVEEPKVCVRSPLHALLPYTPHAADRPRCFDPALRIERGVARGTVCPDEARELGLTIVDLRDAWTPALFAGEDGVVPAFRARYLEIAAEHDAKGRPIDSADALGELYGVVPSLAIVRERLADDARHVCHALIDSRTIATLDQPLGQDHGPMVQAATWLRASLWRQLEPERARRKLDSLADLAAIKPLAATYARLQRLEDQHAGLVAAQRHLVCARYLGPNDADGTMTWRQGNAAELFQRRNFLMPNERIDQETRDAMLAGSRELDFRLALRILRERVVDATGLIEDGTAGAGPQPILGRMLDPAAMRAARGHEKPLPGAAPDLVGAATEAAAKQLAWTGPDEVLAFLTAHPAGVRVAIALPPRPAYHAAHMALTAEIDRGDVWYDEIEIPRAIRHRPSMILYADDRGTKRPLVRWPTTIGGWSDQRTPDGWLHRRWKESEVGPRVWRDLYAAPTWLPPPTTPDRDLVVNLYNGRWDLKRSILGPGPHAAYGMVLLAHHQVVPLPNKRQRFDDHGIGTHGSSSVTSIVNGTSHGCHRMYNQLAVRLASFLLAHRDHEVKGQQPVYYKRLVQHRGTFDVEIKTRGFLYELTPPVPVNVLPGTIRSVRKIPPRGFAPATL